MDKENWRSKGEMTGKSRDEEGEVWIMRYKWERDRMDEEE